MIQIRKDKEGNFRTLEGELVHPMGKLGREVVCIPLEIIFSARGEFDLSKYMEDRKISENAAAYRITREEDVMEDPFRTSLMDTRRLFINFYSKLD